MTNGVQAELPKESARQRKDLSLFKAHEAFEEMESWLMSKEALGLPEHEVETEMEKRGREVNRLMLQAHLNRRGTGDVGEGIEGRRKGAGIQQYVGKRNDPKRVVSIFGEVKVTRRAYVAEGERSVHPLDEEMQLPKRSFSREVQRRVVEEAVRGPFDEVVETIEKTTGNQLSKRSAEEIAEDAAKDFDKFYKQRSSPSVEGTGGIVVAAIDCKGIPMVKKEKGRQEVRLKKGEKVNKKKMATVATVFTQQERHRSAQEVVASLFKEKQEEKRGARIRPEHKRVWAGLEKSKDEVIKEVVDEMAVRDPQKDKCHAVVTDGERALQRKVKKYLPNVILILDLIHAMERLWVAAHALYKEGSQEAVEWVKRHALMMLEGEVSQVVKGMKQSATKRKLKGSKRNAIEAAAKYLYKNRRYMHYDEYLAKGLPIASGAVEGACKHLVKDRMERSGMRWSMSGAEAMLKLRAIRLSGDMVEYWQFHIRKDQQRLYGSLKWKVA